MRQHVFVVISQLLPKAFLLFGLRHLLGPDRLCLCLHRVGDTPRSSNPMPALTVSEHLLDGVLQALLQVKKMHSERWLTVTFDDGYIDSFKYVRSRLHLFHEIDWILFVCPEKALLGAGFRWDLYEKNAIAKDLQTFCDEQPDITSENANQALVQTAQDERFSLASVEECKAFALLPNVALGNHSNCHFRFNTLEIEQARQEINNSHALFQKLFGTCAHFAFPVGRPGIDFNESHVEALRKLGPLKIWSTEQRAFSSEEFQGQNVLPRIGFNGQWTLKMILLKIVLLVAVQKLRKGLRFQKSQHFLMRSNSAN